MPSGTQLPDFSLSNQHALLAQQALVCAQKPSPVQRGWLGGLGAEPKLIERARLGRGAVGVGLMSEDALKLTWLEQAQLEWAIVAIVLFSGDVAAVN